MGWRRLDLDDQTHVIKRDVAASGAQRCLISRGTAVTLAQMYCHGCELRTAAFDINQLCMMDPPILVRKVGHFVFSWREEKKWQRRRGRGSRAWR